MTGLAGAGGCPVPREEAGRIVACGRGLAGTTICRACLAEVATGLALIPGLAEDLTVTLARQDRVAVPQPGGNSEQPLPYNVRASDALEDLGRVTGWWARDLAGEGHLRPFSGIPAAAAWLAAHLSDLAVHPDADSAVLALRDVVTEGLAAVDHPVVLVWLGVCHAEVYDVHSTEVVRDCLGDLYAQPDDASVRCRMCSATHDARNRRWALLAAAREHELNATQLARACRAYGVHTTPSAVRGMARHGQLEGVGTDAAGHPVYRVGDVLDVLRERADARQPAPERRSA